MYKTPTNGVDWNFVFSAGKYRMPFRHTNMDEQKRKFSELQKEIDVKKQELKLLQKRIKPIVKELKAHMKDNGHETMTVNG